MPKIRSSSAGAPRPVTTSFPDRASVKFALQARDPRARKPRGAKRRTAEKLLALAGEQTRAWHPVSGLYRRVDREGKKTYVRA